MRNVVPAVLFPIIALAPALAPAAFSEDWNDPALEDNNWFWFQNGYTGEVFEGDHAMDYSPSGGVTGGYVATPLGSATFWDTVNDHNELFFAYSWDVYNPIDLAADPYLSVALRSFGADLKGGAIYFWIGQFLSSTDFAFFAFDTPLAIDATWTLNQLPITTTGWSTLGIGAASTVNAAAQIFTHPQQWGFVIAGGSEKATGTVGIDNLNLEVPAPGTLALLAIGGLWLRRRR